MTTTDQNTLADPTGADHPTVAQLRHRAEIPMLVMAGKRQYQRTDIPAYLDSVHDHKDGFWLKFSNFMSDHAVRFRRIEPLSDIEQTGWDVHGRML